MHKVSKAANAKYRLAAQYYAETRDKKQALMKVGYSESYATARGYTIFDREDVKGYVAEYMARLQERHELTVDWIIDQYMTIASVDATDVVQIVTKYETIDGKEVPYQDVVVKSTAELTKEQKAAIKSIKQTKYGIAIEMYSKDVALGKLGEYLGIFKQNINVSGSVESSNPYEGLTVDELKALVASKKGG